MNSQRIQTAVVNVTTWAIVIVFIYWVTRERANDHLPLTNPIAGVPEGKEYDIEYQRTVHDSRDTFQRYPIWQGGPGAPAVLCVSDDGSFTVTQYGKIVHTGFISCIQDAGSERDKNAIARFRVDYVVYQGEPSSSTVEWMCYYHPRLKLKGPSLELWTPKQSASVP